MTNRFSQAIATLFLLFICTASYSDSVKDGFGISFPSGVRAAEVISLIAPDKDPSLALIVGMKPWPYKKHTYIGFVCFAVHQRDFENKKHPSSGEKCGSHYPKGGNSIVANSAYLGVIEYIGAGQNMRLVARSGDLADLVATVSPEKRLDSFKDYIWLDFAPFRITNKDVAFGLRFTMSSTYAGGGAQSEYLALFRINEKKIENILTEPMSVDSVIAGNWNDDGTRGHDYDGSTYVLSVLKHTTQGYNDLRIAQTGGRWKTTFVWSSETNRYKEVK